jgi:hypothetical protein
MHFCVCQYGDGPQRMFMNEWMMYECIYCIKKNKCKKSGIRPPNLLKKYSWRNCFEA